MTKATADRKQETDRVALEIIRLQAAARKAKTARLRDARLALQQASKAD